jgi:DNA modification methylase
MPINSVTENLDNANISNFMLSKNMPRHRWYYFKEGFSPLLVETAIKKSEINEDDLVIDIFSGCGTVPLVSSLSNVNSIGYEINPFMIFVAKAKLSDVKSNTFNFYLDKIVAGIKKGKKTALENYSTFSENGENEKWLFNKKVLRGFEGGWETTKEIPYEVAKLYRLALVSSTMMNSNAVKDGKCLRYKKNWKELLYSQDSLLNDFIENCTIIADDLKNTRILKVATILKGDVREKLGGSKIKKFKLCITSPPYLNSFDYSDIYRPELFLCKYITNNNNLGKLRLGTLRSHMQINWELPKKSEFGMLYEKSTNELSKKKELLWNKKIPTMIQAYFEDIETLLIKLKRNAEKDAQLWIIVSTSAYAGVEIPVDLIIADIGTKKGWELVEIKNIRNMRNSTQNAQKYIEGIGTTKRLRECIIILKNRP